MSGTPGASKWGDREAFPKTIFAISATHVSIELISANRMNQVLQSHDACGGSCGGCRFWPWVAKIARIVLCVTGGKSSSANRSASTPHFNNPHKIRSEENLNIRTGSLGKEHPDTLESVDKLGLVLRGQGKYEAAEKMHQRALAGRELALGREHPDTL